MNQSFKGGPGPQGCFQTHFWWRKHPKWQFWAGTCDTGSSKGQNQSKSPYFRFQTHFMERLLTEWMGRTGWAQNQTNCCQRGKVPLCEKRRSLASSSVVSLTCLTLQNKLTGPRTPRGPWDSQPLPPQPATEGWMLNTNIYCECEIILILINSLKHVLNVCIQPPYTQTSFPKVTPVSSVFTPAALTAVNETVLVLYDSWGGGPPPPKESGHTDEDESPSSTHSGRLPPSSSSSLSSASFVSSVFPTDIHAAHIFLHDNRCNPHTDFP